MQFYSENWPVISKIVKNTVLWRHHVQWKVKAYWLWPPSNTEKSIIMYTSGLFAQISNCDKMSFVERIWLVIIQIKTSTNEANIP